MATMGALPRFEAHRAHVEAIVEAVRRAADPRQCLAAALRDEGWKPNRTSVYAVGKAALEMEAALGDVIGDACPIEGGPLLISAIVVPRGTPRTDGSVFVYEADHPEPTGDNVDAAATVAHLLKWDREQSQADPDRPRRILLLLSGGASALLTLPVDGATVSDVRAVTAALMRAGADIRELNTVRKHIDLLKGGRMAALASPMAIDAYILSDVIGNDLSVIGSGPVSPDPTTFADALEVLRRRGCESASPAITAYLRAGARGEHPETPKPGESVFDRVTTRIIADNNTVVDAAAAEAARIGFRVQPPIRTMQGEAGRAGEMLASRVRECRVAADRPGAIVLGGETTVNVGEARGVGGRNLELALAAAVALDGEEGVVVATFATDGVDGPTDAAGAAVTGESVGAGRAAGMDAGDYLARHDSHAYLDRLGALIRTGPTGTTVNDIAVALVY